MWGERRSSALWDLEIELAYPTLLLRRLDAMTPLPPHRSLALGIFRQSAFFIFAIAAFAERDEHTRTLLTVSVFLLDVVSWHLSEVVAFYTHSVYNRVWHDTLTNRFLLEYLSDRIKAKQHIDVPALVKESTAAAKEDIARYLRDSTVWFEWGRFRKFLLGLGQFLWYWIGYGIFYGIAGAIGTSLRSPF